MNERGRSMPRTGVRLLLTLLACGLVLAGCAHLPTSGPIRSADLGRVKSDGGVEVPPVTPQPGFTRKQVVNGFIEAMAQDALDHSGARQFLSARVRDTWSPNGVTVVESDELHAGEKPNRLLYTANKTGRIQGDGSWDAASGPFEKSFELTKEKGEWRITNPPRTLLRPASVLRSGFQSYNIYFFDSDSEILVPDPVYLATGTGIETRLVEAVLDGPTGGMQPVLHSAVPQGLDLAGTAVAVNNGIATIDLDESFLEEKESVQVQVASQLAWTLKQVGVQAIRITVNSRPLPIGDLGEKVRAPARYAPGLPKAPTTAYTILDEAIGRVDGDGVTPLRLPGGPSDPEQVAPALRSPGGREGKDQESAGPRNRLAVVSGSQDATSELWVYPPGGRPEQPVHEGYAIRSLSWDRTGKLWFIEDAPKAASLRYLTPDGEVKNVKTPGIEAGVLKEVKVSRDGARVALLLERENGTTELQVGFVKRSGGLRIGGRETVPTGLSKMSDLAWSDIAQITVVGSEQSDAGRLVQVPVDGSDQQELPIAHPVVSIAAAPNRAIIAGGGEGETLYVHDSETDYGWRALEKGWKPAYPG